MTFIIVGAGATGIELAGALAEMRKFILPHDYPDLDTSTMRIILIDGGPRLLSAFSPQSSEEVKKYLTHLGGGQMGVKLLFQVLQTRIN